MQDFIDPIQVAYAPRTLAFADREAAGSPIVAWVLLLAPDRVLVIPAEGDPRSTQCCRSLRSVVDRWVSRHGLELVDPLGAASMSVSSLLADDAEDVLRYP